MKSYNSIFALNNLKAHITLEEYLCNYAASKDKRMNFSFINKLQQADKL